MRTFGWKRAAERVASELDRETIELLNAYSAGVNASDRPDSAYRTSTMEARGEARLHPAPLTRAAVERIAKTRLTPAGDL